MVYCPNCGKPHKAKSRITCKACFDAGYDGQQPPNEDDEDFEEDELENDLEELTEEQLNKPVTQMIMSDIINVIKIVNAPMSKKLDSVVVELNKTLSEVGERVRFLESENKRKDDIITSMKSTIVNMQKSLNSIDGNDRKLNLIVTGLTEDDIVFEDGQSPTLTSDKEKISWLVTNLLHDDNVAINIDEMDIQRIGKVRDGFHRALKIGTPSIEVRNSILTNTKKLKGAEGVWKKVFINRDQHPVYVEENKRLRKKAYDLRQDPSNGEVKIQKNILYVDGNIVDKNMFFG